MKKPLHKRRSVKQKAVSVATKPPDPVPDGDPCSMCGRLTDSIMQSRRGMVCECCLESADESDEEDRY